MKKEDKYDVAKVCLENECCIPLIRSIDECSDNLDFLRKVGDIISLAGNFVVEGKVNVENFFNCTLKLVNKPQATAVLGGAIAASHYLKAQTSLTDLSESPVGKALTWLVTAIFTEKNDLIVSTNV